MLARSREQLEQSRKILADSAPPPVMHLVDRNDPICEIAREIAALAIKTPSSVRLVSRRYFHECRMNRRVALALLRNDRRLGDDSGCGSALDLGQLPHACGMPMPPRSNVAVSSRDVILALAVDSPRLSRFSSICESRPRTVRGYDERDMDAGRRDRTCLRVPDAAMPLSSPGISPPLGQWCCLMAFIPTLPNAPLLTIVRPCFGQNCIECLVGSST